MSLQKHDGVTNTGYQPVLLWTIIDVLWESDGIPTLLDGRLSAPIHPAMELQLKATIWTWVSVAGPDAMGRPSQRHQCVMWQCSTYCKKEHEWDQIKTNT
ncbi:unnamed protein product [Calypogeia fissa]